MNKLKIIKNLFCLRKTSGKLIFFYEKNRVPRVIIKCLQSVLKFTYLKGSCFGSDLLKALNNDTLTQYLQELSIPNLLIFDEAEYFDGKEATQQELYKLFRQRLDSNKTTMIISALNIEHFSDLYQKDLLDYLTLYK